MIRNRSLVVGLTGVIFLISLVVVVTTRLRYDASVRSDVSYLVALANDNPSGKPIISFDQLAMDDALRNRQIDRAYSLKSSPTGYVVCSQYYRHIWSISHNGMICEGKKRA